MKTSTRLLFLVIGLLALTVACTGSDDGDSSATPSSTGTGTAEATETATATATPSPTADDDDDGSSSGSSGNSEDDVRRDVTTALNSVLGEELDVAEFAKYSPNECPQDLAELALAFAFLQAFLGEAELEFEVSEVELLGDDRALVTLTGSGEFLEAFGPSEDEDEADLWVLQDGRWRSTSDCEPFDDEREALGLSTTADDFDDFDGGFGSDFGPPVAAALGQPLPVGDLVVTINGASFSTEPLNDSNDPPQGVLVVVDFTFANDGQEPTSPWWALTMEIFDDRDRTWETQDLPFEDVGPGFSQEFQVSWDVPEDATGFRVIVSADPFVDLPLPDDFAPWEVPLGAFD